MHPLIRCSPRGVLLKDKTNFKKNTALALTYQIVAACIGFIMPRFFITAYGSTINGSISTISQLAGFLGLLEAGMGSVASVAFYRSLSNNGEYDLTTVRNTVRRYYRIVAGVSIALCGVLAVILPFTLKNGEPFIFNFDLVIIVSCGYFIQYYMGVTSQLLLAADYKAYINSLTQIVAVVLNFAITMLLIHFRVDVRLVKLISVLVMLVRPVILAVYVKNKYTFSGSKAYDNGLMKQRWNNLGQSLAYYIHTQTDMVVIMLFLTVAENSVYGLYMAIVAAVKMVATALLSNFNPVLGRACAEGNAEDGHILKTFRKFMLANSFVINVLFSVTAVLIIPFMRLYSEGFDYNYIRPEFAICLCLSEYLYLYRNPYNTLINVNGHFKETQASAFVEAGVNIVLSIALVNVMGITGVAVGTAVAMLYRMIYCIVYTKKNLLEIPVMDIVKPASMAVVTALSVAAVILLVDLSVVNNYFAFVVAGVVLVLMFALIQITMSYLVYRFIK